MATQAPTTDAPRIRILCLHGYTQNAEIFRGRIAVVRKDMKDVDFDFIDGPHRVPDQLQQFTGPLPATGSGPRSWWNFHETPSTGVSESLAHIATHWSAASPPYTGIMGFSQGATMAALALPVLDPPARFSIHVSGFLPQDADQLHMLVPDRLRNPSLHVMGRTDAWIAPDRSQALRDRFGKGGTGTDDDDGCIVRTRMHDGGHFVPSGKVDRRVFREFVTSLGLAELTEDDG
ncbi:hypothetical protein HKX48_004756 [Thoreauomyces humboldtii]|nr:hypothetical protein HKX48_004756 [Thoreauomyces humboldtii]